MRTIRKRPQPRELTEWRTPRLARDRPHGMACTYEELRRDPRALTAVEDGLLDEQGRICAYTGIRIGITQKPGAAEARRDVSFHIEHLIPQEHCAAGQDADYGNLVACWPRPNCGFQPKFGAIEKGNWPRPADARLFVSPLDPSCTERFSFNHRGKVSAAMRGDAAAEETIKRLGLDEPSLEELRRNAIRGALNPGSRPIKLKDAEKLRREMASDVSKLERGESIQLAEFCFAIQQAVDREIRKLEGIMRRR